MRSQLLPSCYKRPMLAGFTAQRPLRRPFLGSIRSGTPCAPIPLSKNSARKSSRELRRFFSELKRHNVYEAIALISWVIEVARKVQYHYPDYAAHRFDLGPAPR